MKYSDAVEYLYSQTPQFQQIGAAAYKPGLDTVKALANAFGNPQKQLKVIHVAGTNGKGSTAHTIAAVLQSAGYKTALYTSPHLVDFRERMRINGEMIPRQEVFEFVEKWKQMQPELALEPSFFELTTVMAFNWFAREKVDYAVIEVGLGGRLDSTNIVDPLLCIITNISFDHTAQLGNTLAEIAYEKAGILKPGVPAVSGETNPEVRAVLAHEAAEHGTTIRFACEDSMPAIWFKQEPYYLEVEGTPFGSLRFQLTGNYQRANVYTILAGLELLRDAGVEFPDDAVREGFANVCTLTGLQGRWMRVQADPLVITDTGHNIGGWEHLSKALETMPRPLTMVIGFVNDKDISHILPLMPRDARYIFTRADIPRALPVEQLAEKARGFGLEGTVAHSVEDAYSMALAETPQDGSIFVGGSTFIVADLLSMLDANF